MIPYFLALDVGVKICQAQRCSSIRGCHAIFLVKNTLFKGEVVWQPLKEQQICSCNIFEPPTWPSNEVLFVFLPSLVLKPQLIIFKECQISWNLPYKGSHFWLVSCLNFCSLRTHDGKITNNMSFEGPSRWLQNTTRSDLLLFQGLSRNLSFKKCIFY